MGRMKIFPLLATFLILLGVFAFLIISHEAYHYFQPNGTPTGVCFGKCYLGETYKGTNITQTWATSGVAWKNFTLSPDELAAQESHAWYFSLSLTAVLVAFLIWRAKVE